MFQKKSEAVQTRSLSGALCCPLRWWLLRTLTPSSTTTAKMSSLSSTLPGADTARTWSPNTKSWERRYGPHWVSGVDGVAWNALNLCLSRCAAGWRPQCGHCQDGRHSQWCPTSVWSQRVSLQSLHSLLVVGSCLILFLRIIMLNLLQVPHHLLCSSGLQNEPQEIWGECKRRDSTNFCICSIIIGSREVSCESTPMPHWRLQLDALGLF